MKNSEDLPKRYFAHFDKLSPVKITTVPICITPTQLGNLCTDRLVIRLPRYLINENLIKTTPDNEYRNNKDDQ
jgi:hypothetical protein